jgi:hypothetical protein
MRPLVVIGALVVVAAAAAGGWYFWSRNNGGAQAGAGQYQAAMTECQDQVFNNAMEPDDLKFVDGTTWHEVRADKSILLGGKMTKLNELGRPRSYAYQCIAQGLRVISVDVR